MVVFANNQYCLEKRNQHLSIPSYCDQSDIYKVLMYIQDSGKYWTGNVNFIFLTNSCEMIETPGLLSCSLRGCILRKGDQSLYNGSILHNKGGHHPYISLRTTFLKAIY